jgi:hypothetical protein
LQIKKFQFAYQTLKEIRKKFNDCQIPLIFPENFPFSHDSIIARSLNQTFSLVRENFTHHSIGNFFETIELKKYFRDNSSLIEFETFLLEQEKRIDYHSFSQSLRKIQQTPANLQEIQFYQRWGKHIRVQMVQGLEDANQILGEGICWGLCQRICLEGADYPHISPEEFAKKITITQKDRFLQSIHSYGTRSNIPESFLLPEQVLQREGIDSDSTIFELNWDKEQNVLKGWLESNFEQLGESFGWFRLSLKMETALQQSLGHVICIRFDTLNHCYWLVDPNIGFLTFEGANLPPRTAQENALSFFKELIQYYYSSTTQIHGTQHRR